MFSVMTSTFSVSAVFTRNRSDCAAWIATTRCWRISSMRCSSATRRSSCVVDLMYTTAITVPAAEQASRSIREMTIFRFIEGPPSPPALLVAVLVLLEIEPGLARQLEHRGVVLRRGLDEADRPELLEDARALRIALEVEQGAAERLAQVLLEVLAHAQPVRRHRWGGRDD